MSSKDPKALILVVEDNDDVRGVVSIYLRRNGYSVAEAADGQAGLDAVSKVKPDMILLDVLLPRLDGIEVLKRLRASEIGKNIPIVMMSAVLQIRDLKAETAKLNVSSVLQKPFQMRTIVDCVEKALSPGQPKQELPKTRESTTQMKTISSSPGYRHEKRLHMTRKADVSNGSLKAIPVPELLHSVFVESRTGRLQIFSGTTEKRVFFQNGMPVYAESSLPNETLGAHLVRRGRLTEEQNNAAITEMTATGRHFGEVLLKLELIGPHELFTELECHLSDKVISTFGWFDGSFTFEDGDDWKDDVIVARMKPGRILLDGIRRFWTPKIVQQRLRITDKSRTFPMDATPYSEEQLGFSTQETRIFQLIKRGLTVGEIIAQESDLHLVTSVMYALFVMEHMGFVLSELPGDKGSSTGSIDVAKRTEEQGKALLTEYLKFRTADYFKLLGVSRDASSEEITRAFKERRKRYHPDTLVGIDTGLIHEKIEELYIRIHNAYRTLVSAESRQEYLAGLEEKEKMQPMAARSKTGRVSTLETRDEDAVVFEEGFSLLRGGQFIQALDFFNRAQDLNAKPRYEAYIAWTSFLINPDTLATEALKKLTELKSKNKDDALYSYLLGNLSLRQKNTKQAVAFFEQAVKIDPGHIDAARQLRLLRMRQTQSEVSGLFDLFKGKKK